MRPALLATLIACSMQKPSATPPNDWATIAGGRVQVEVERALYVTAGTDHFFVHVRVTNPGAAIGVDLRAYHQVFYPNQWGASATEHRTVIDERRVVLGPLDAPATAAILADHKAGLLTPIAAGASLEYFEEFNASSRADVDTQAKGAPFVIVTMDGQLKLADGTTASRVTPTEDAREVAIHAPVAWKTIPNGAHVIVDR